MNKTKTIQSILMSLPEDKLRIVIPLLDIISATNNNISKTVKWGRITFCYQLKPIAFLCTHRDKIGVELGFFHDIQSSELTFTSNGSSAKRIQFINADDISIQLIKRLIKQAITITKLK